MSFSRLAAGAQAEPSPAPRAVCGRCRRPRSVCFCAELVPIPTKTRVLILQHPRERDVGIGTARIARLGLANAALRIDVDFSADPVVQSALAGGNAYVLFPGEGAIAVETARFAEPITLIVVDGTRWQAQKLIRANPAIAALPRLALTPSALSVYGQIRREPADHCVATLEAIAQVLGHLEGDHERFRPLLAPLEAMVERQLHFVHEVADHRHHRVYVPRAPRDPVPAMLRERAPDLVCVHGEANAWPRLDPSRTAPEIVHWLAERASTGETFESVLAPRGRLAPSTCRHIRLDEPLLHGGESWPSFAARFRAFLRPGDVLVSWGCFPMTTLLADGWSLEHPHVDVRPIVGNVLKRRTGTVEDCVAAMELAAPTAWGRGRGGLRLASLCAVLGKLLAWRKPAAS